jgi:hypothetical protein
MKEKKKALKKKETENFKVGCQLFFVFLFLFFFFWKGKLDFCLQTFFFVIQKFWVERKRTKTHGVFLPFFFLTFKTKQLKTLKKNISSKSFLHFLLKKKKKKKDQKKDFQYTKQLCFFFSFLLFCFFLLQFCQPSTIKNKSFA